MSDYVTCATCNRILAAQDADEDGNCIYCRAEPEPIDEPADSPDDTDCGDAAEDAE